MRGTVSHGTLRTCDLIPAFLDALREVAPDAYAQVVCTPFSVIPSDASGDNSHEFWESDDAQSLLESLFDTLNEYAPEGYYFGAHLGDGSDFGFWECDDES